MQQQLRSFSYRIPSVTRPAQSGLDRCADRSRFNCYKPRERLRHYADGVGNTPPERPEKPPECGMETLSVAMNVPKAVPRPDER